MQLIRRTAYFTLLTCMFIFSTLSYAGSYKTTGQRVNDTTITTTIKASYAKNPILSPFKLSVKTNKGIVSIRGEVDSDTQFERAVMIAESVRGVKDVNTNNLTVKESKQPMEDTFITAKIKGLLIKKKIFEPDQVNYWDVKVETKNNIVYLSGKVDSKQRKSTIIDIAKSVKGVKSVESDLKVK